MTTTNTTNLASSELVDQICEKVKQTTADELGHISISELLACLMSTLQESERNVFLENHPDDKGNGSYRRSLAIGSLPLDVDIPRTRSGDFRSAALPPPYQRSYADQTQKLLLGMLTASRSVNAVKSALGQLGLGQNSKELERIADQFVEQFDLRNSRPLPTDMLALYVDGKYIEIRDNDRIRPACVYVVVGLDRSGLKRILACHVYLGRESLENWKRVFSSLLERGLRRLLILVQDDFTGLRNLSSRLFPDTDIQLCIVHMNRNAKIHLNKAEFAEFNLRFLGIKNCWDPCTAAAHFDDLCQRFLDASPNFIKELQKKRPHYLHFLNYPQDVRKTFSTTNAVEAVNGQLERMRRNNGGYFQSDKNVKINIH